MEYYKYLDLPYTEDTQHRVLQTIKSLPRIYNRVAGINLLRLPKDLIEQTVPELPKLFKPLGMIPREYLAFVMWNGLDCGVHADTYPQAARVNLPVVNCSGTRTCFYADVDPIEIRNAEGRPLRVARNQSAVPVDCADSNRPLVLKVHEFHKVIMPIGHEVPRITLSIGFAEDAVSLFEVNPC